MYQPQKSIHDEMHLAAATAGGDLLASRVDMQFEYSFQIAAQDWDDMFVVCQRQSDI